MVRVHADPPHGVKLPLATFLSLPVSYGAFFSVWNLCEADFQVPTRSSSGFFYCLVFSLSGIKLPFASPTVPRTALETVYHMYKFI